MGRQFAARSRESVSEGAERWLWLAASGAVAWSFGYALVPGSDLFWHVAAGRWILAHGGLHTGDPFSFSMMGAEWRNHEWLSDVLFAVWERAFGLATLVHWKWAVIVSTYALLHRTLVRLGASAPAAFVSVALSAGLASPLLDVRPHLYSLLGFVVVMHAAGGRARPLPWLPIAFFLWANLHAGVTFGIVALALLLLPILLAGAARDRRSALWCGAACVVASVATPNGFASIAYAMRYAFDVASPYRDIVEWQSPLSAQALRLPLYPYAVGVVIAAVVYRGLASTERLRPAEWSLIAVVLTTLAMSLRSVRFVPLFALAGAVVLAPVCTALLGDASARVGGALRTALPAFVTAALIGFVASTRPVTSRAFEDLTMLPTYPVAMMDFVVANDLTGNAFALYNWGGYIELRTGGRLKVYIDGRADTVYSDRVYTDYRSVMSRATGWEEIIARSGADYVLWPRVAARHWQDLLDSGAWRVLHSDVVSVLLVRADHSVPAAPIIPDSAYRRFADGWDAFLAGDRDRGEAELTRAAAMDPGSTQICRVQLLMAAANKRPIDREARERCERRFPYQNYLTARLGFARVPRGPS
jgi:hypothetical protein